MAVRVAHLKLQVIPRLPDAARTPELYFVAASPAAMAKTTKSDRAFSPHRSRATFIQRVLMPKTGGHVYYFHDRERDWISSLIRLLEITVDLERHQISDGLAARAVRR